MIQKLYLIFFIFSIQIFSQKLPEGFVYLSNIDATIQKELRYLSTNNFIGKPIDGYLENKVIVTKKTAIALKKIQTKLYKEGLSLKIFDAYRPQKAVNHFVRWAKVLEDTIMKKKYYPNVLKSQLFQKGYIAHKSGHTRGSTIDLTIVSIKDGKELDMGSNYDYFGIQSHPFFNGLSKLQQKNRMFLRKVMLAENFSPYDNEWWHFTLKKEPFPKRYFDFNIE
ncbi:M15 family metallopeptidase [Polaribacter sp.]|uniref:M15 family metallopeptidase n=1 Tax=Polaribacter sp. TaxID=1920175 RepID=UPI0025FD9C83|nr:M15 family metallopeptidase [Polaribacter sp.]